MFPPLGGSSGGCLAVWSISQQRGYCSREYTVRPPHPCRLSCGAPLLGRRPPPGLCTAAGGGTAPDTRRPSQRWQATPPGDDPSPSPRHAAPTGHAGQGDSVGLPHPHTRAHSTWVADPNSPPQWAGTRGRDRAWPQTPLTMMEGTPPGTPFRHPHSEQRRPAGAHAVGPVLGPHARTDRTRDTGSWNPGCPLQRAGGRGRGSA